MGDLIVGFGLMLVFEGLIWALAPALGVRMLAAAAATPYPSLRLAGTIAVAAGVVLVWIIRG